MNSAEDARKHLGFTWSSASVAFGAVPDVPVARALARFDRDLAQHAWHAAALEGNALSLVQTETLLDGRLPASGSFDENQVLALADSARMLHDMVKSGRFEPTKEVSDRLHGVVAVHEAIEAGHFRGEGSVRGGGTVNLGGGGTYYATGCEDRGEALRDEYDRGLACLSTLQDPVERAVAYFCFGTRHQFYFDGNKRTSRLMMNGILMSSGHDAIIIPFDRQTDFDRHLVTLYTDADATALMEFIIGCRPSA